MLSLGNTIISCFTGFFFLVQMKGLEIWIEGLKERRLFPIPPPSIQLLWWYPSFISKEKINNK